ncbi:CBS domain-containing protein [Nocardia otitidiscaviarum]|uniref:CBS domain-containing protein n=1 Tax=Nocardia otitidiscaviarum TaxID=1823 RepID=A0A516NX68_9NOCA|nr:CBS domain-containing protein [Nocardia otitidiscaviarum]MCP9619123.1 CBS domain-containing protein [Nocardia otitidiscaviarum]QDP83464.1 CBS domain-containing protein [Nocardia otitidiscaviarum]
MRISEILRRKGSDVVTIAPDATVHALLEILATNNVGAVVVSPDASYMVGIVSERDVVRALHRHGAVVLGRPVSEIMTDVVHTCCPEDRVETLNARMTEHRIRHLPVVRDGRMIGIVSIGDVVKSQIAELETEREHLVQYLHG